MTRSAANLAIFVLSLLGCVVSLFLTIKYVQNADIPCTRGSSDCNAVASDSAAWGLGIAALKPIPTPALGLLMYAFLAGLSMVRVISASSGNRVAGDRAGLIQWVVSASALLVSGYLTWREAAVIHHWCVWCVGSAIIVLILFLISSAERIGGAPAARKEGLEAT